MSASFAPSVSIARPGLASLSVTRFEEKEKKKQSKISEEVKLSLLGICEVTCA